MRMGSMTVVTVIMLNLGNSTKVKCFACDPMPEPLQQKTLVGRQVTSVTGAVLVVRCACEKHTIVANILQIIPARWKIIDHQNLSLIHI